VATGAAAPGDVGLHWATWWLGDSSGILLVAPVFLVRRHGGEVPPAARVAAFFAALALAGGLVFLADWSGEAAQLGHALTYLAFPFVVVAALWLGGPGAVAAAAAIAALAIVGTLRGLGPFADGGRHVTMVLLQVYFIATAITGLILAAVKAERQDQTGALQDKERTLRRIFDQSPIGIALVALDLRFLKVNDALCRITGRPAEELLRLGVPDITHPDDIGAGAAGGTRMLSGDIDQLVQEKRYLRPNGEVVWINMLARPVRDDTGRPLYFVGMMEDITGRKRTERALAEAKHAAERSDRAKTRFLAATSHDLRQPLLAANLFLESLARRTAAAAAAPAPEIERLRQALTAMGEMLDVLLDLSRIDAGVVRADPRDIRLGRLLGDLARNWSEVAAASGLKFRAVPCSLIVRTDPVLLMRVLRNLLENAVKYTESGRILLGCRRHGDVVRIQVWDTGVGIPAEQRDAIFQEFYQIDNANRDRTRGMGIGLSIVRRLAGVLDHPVALCSWPGRGSMFEIGVPLGHHRETRDAPEPPVPAERPLSGTVVIIEDDSLVLSSLEVVVAQWGARVIAAPSAGAAWERLRDGGECPAILLADYRLADGWTGVDAVRWLREKLGAPVPAALISGDTSGDQLEAMRASGLRLISKPVPAAALRAILQEYC